MSAFRAEARQDADARAVVVVPADRDLALHRLLQVEGDGQVHEDGVVPGDHEVVHHGRARHLDLRAVHEVALRVEHVVGEIGRQLAVAEEVELVGLGAELRVGREGGLELPVVVEAAHRLELAVELEREVALLEGEDLAGVADDVGVRGARRAVHHDLGVHGLLAALELGRLHPAVAVPEGLPVLDAHAVDHAVAEEPVGALAALRVGRVAHVEPAQLAGDLAGHAQAGLGDLVRDRGVVAGQEPGLLFDGTGAHGDLLGGATRTGAPARAYRGGGMLPG